MRLFLAFERYVDGSSSLQTLGGMSGAIIVEDPPGSLSPAMEAMREIVMVLQETNIQSGEGNSVSCSLAFATSIRVRSCCIMSSDRNVATLSSSRVTDLVGVDLCGGKILRS